MRRTLFYLLITLFAFGSGIAAFKYHLQKVEEQKKLNYINTINRWKQEIESQNKGFDELEKANDGDLITVQDYIDEKFLCLDVTDEHPNVCTTVLTGNSSEEKSLMIRLNVCDESNNSNCIVWKPDNKCSAGELCFERITVYDNDGKPTDLKEVIFNDGFKAYTRKSVQFRVTGKVSIEENKPKLLTPIEKIEIIELR